MEASSAQPRPDDCHTSGVTQVTPAPDRTLYISLDVETTGRVPGLHSMVSLGAVVVEETPDQVQLLEGASFCANVEELPWSGRCHETMAWWSRQPEAWEATRQGARSPESAMLGFDAWLRALGPGRRVLVAYPAAFDEAWISYYAWRFLGRAVVRAHPLCLRTFAAGILNIPFAAAKKERLPEHIRPPGRVAHHALEDAEEQAEILMRLLAEVRAREAPPVGEAEPAAGPGPVGVWREALTGRWHAFWTSAASVSVCSSVTAEACGPWSPRARPGGCCGNCLNVLEAERRRRST